MRIPKIENYNNKNLIETVKLPKPTNLSTQITIMNEKEKVKLIKTIERVARSSMEYKQYIKFLKDEIDMTKCTYFNGVNSKSKRVSIEIHHEPFTLFDITQMVVDKTLDEGTPLNTFMLAEEVMKIHYMGLVGLLPLSVTVHELVHNGKLFIPLQSVYGNFVKFLDKYEKYIPNDTKEMLQTKIRMSKELSTLDLSVLEKKYMYLEVEGMSFPQPLQEELIQTG